MNELGLMFLWLRYGKERERVYAGLQVWVHRATEGKWASRCVCVFLIYTRLLDL